MDHDVRNSNSSNKDNNNDADTFEIFMIGLKNCAHSSCEDSCDVSAVSQDLEIHMSLLDRRR